MVFDRNCLKTAFLTIDDKQKEIDNDEDDWSKRLFFLLKGRLHAQTVSLE